MNHTPTTPEAERGLKPCPFCGGPVKLERASDTHSPIHGHRQWWGVVCRSSINLGGTCAIEQRPSASVDAAIERWNRRAPMGSAEPADIKAIAKAAFDQIITDSIEEGDAQNNEDFYAGKMAGIIAMKTAIESTPRAPASPNTGAVEQVARDRAAALGRAGMEFAANICRLDSLTVKGVDYVRREDAVAEAIRWREQFNSAPAIPRPTHATPSPSKGGDDAQMIWDLALADAAFYVEGHCANGEHHAETIMAMPLPKIISKGGEADSAAEWVSVDERLPEQGLYLVASTWGVRPAYKHDPKWDKGFQDAINNSDEGTNDFDGRMNGAFHVTHWMPIPAPPAMQPDTGEKK